MAFSLGDSAGARAHWEEYLVTSRKVDDQFSIADALSLLSVLARERGDYGAAWSLSEESLAIQRTIGDRQAIATSVNRLGEAAMYRGDLIAARPLLEESLMMRRNIGDAWGIGWSLMGLGQLARDAGNLAEARAFLEESLATHRGIDFQYGMVCLLAELGDVCIDLGDRTAARKALQESLLTEREFGASGVAVSAIEYVANMAVVESHFERALRLAAAACTQRAVGGERLRPAAQARQDRKLDLARTQLGDAASTAAQAAGRVMPLEQAIVEALSFCAMLP